MGDKNIARSTKKYQEVVLLNINFIKINVPLNVNVLLNDRHPPINVLLNDRQPPTANRQPPTANHDEKNYIILGFFSITTAE